MLKKTRRVLLVLMVLALLLPAFGAVHAQEDCNFADEVIRFGGIAPMSAPGAVAGGCGDGLGIPTGCC